MRRLLLVAFLSCVAANKCNSLSANDSPGDFRKLSTYAKCFYKKDKALNSILGVIRRMGNQQQSKIYKRFQEIFGKELKSVVVETERLSRKGWVKRNNFGKDFKTKRAELLNYFGGVVASASSKDFKDILIEVSEGKKCKENEELLQCGSACEPSCEDPDPVICTMQCLINACQCTRGFVRNAEGNCVVLSKCPKKTPKDYEDEEEQEGEGKGKEGNGDNGKEEEVKEEEEKEEEDD